MSFLFGFWNSMFYRTDKKQEYKKLSDSDNKQNSYGTVGSWDSLKPLRSKRKKGDELNDESDGRFYYLSLLKENRTPGWSIHGLWPQYDTKNYPVYCKKVVFNYESLKPIIEKLEKNWYSNKDDSGKKLQQDENFWKHEWEKHGSCMFKDIDEFHYFNIALNLFHFALQKKLPDKWYHPETGKCLIPVDLNFQFIDS